MRGAVNTGLSLRRVKITVAEGYLRRNGSDVCTANTAEWRTIVSVYLLLVSHGRMYASLSGSLSSLLISSVVEIRICGKH